MIIGESVNVEVRKKKNKKKMDKVEKLWGGGLKTKKGCLESCAKKTHISRVSCMNMMC
jgi:hypothetical protein